MNNLDEKRSVMISMVENWRSSGKSKKQYCLEKGINMAKFITGVLVAARKKVYPGTLFR